MMLKNLVNTVNRVHESVKRPYPMNGLGHFKTTEHDIRTQTTRQTYIFLNQRKTGNNVLRNMIAPGNAATGVRITCVPRTKSAFSPVPSREFKYSGAVEPMIALVTRSCKVKGRLQLA